MLNLFSPDKISLTPGVLPLDWGGFYYKIVENFRHRPAPVVYDRPPADASENSIQDFEPGDIDASDVEEFLFDRFTNNIKDLDEGTSDGVPYVHTETQTHIPLATNVQDFSLKDEILRSEVCRKAAVSLLEPKSADLYHSVLHCMKFWCEKCGGKDGFIKKRRKKLLHRKINRGASPKNKDDLMAIASGWVVRQFVFTVPEKDRPLFCSRNGLNKLLGSARRLIKAHFPGSRVIAVVQVVGDKDKEKFHPHIHVLIFNRKNENLTLKLTPAVLDTIKDRWARGLRMLGCSGIHGPGEKIKGKQVDVHYNFATTPERVLHMINYVTKPLSHDHLKAWQDSRNSQDMIDLCVRELKGFQYMRNWDRWAGCNYYDTEDAVKEVESAIGAPVIFMGFTSMKFIYDLVASGHVKKFGDDLYRQPGRFSIDYLPQAGANS